MSIGHCIACENPFKENFFDFGKHPPSNRFQENPSSSIDKIPLTLFACQTCGLIQLHDKPNINFLTPRFPWIRYNEPDAHLDDLYQKWSSYFIESGNACGVGPFDQPLLTRLASKMQCQIFNFLEKETPIDKIYPYLETIQSKFDIPFLKEITSQTYDVLICRYLLEHCHNPIQALKSFQSLLTEKGHVIIEVPDSTKFITRLDYSFIWEEHLMYFSEKSFINLIETAGYQLIDLQRYENHLEDSIVALIQPTHLSKKRELSETPNIFNQYVSSFKNIKSDYIKKLSQIKNKGEKIVIFGAGHQAIMFINLFDLSPYISCVIDDDPNKQSHFTPGSNLPIVSSNVLNTDPDIKTCLLATPPRIEDRIKQKFPVFLDRGGKMFSIFHGVKSHLLGL